MMTTTEARRYEATAAKKALMVLSDEILMIIQEYDMHKTMDPGLPNKIDLRTFLGKLFDNLELRIKDLEEESTR